MKLISELQIQCSRELERRIRRGMPQRWRDNYLFTVDSRWEKDKLILVVYPLIFEGDNEPLVEDRQGLEIARRCPSTC